MSIQAALPWEGLSSVEQIRILVAADRLLKIPRDWPAASDRPPSVFNAL